MVFETKKIRIETLSEYLLGIRQDLRLSQDVVVARSGACGKFLEYLESGEFQKLPPNVYVYGILRQLAEVYGVSAEMLIGQFKKERGMVEPQFAPAETKNTQPKFLQKLVVTPKLISLGAGLIFVGATVVYVAWQVITLNAAPKLVVLEPKPGQVLKSALVEVSGQTDSGNTLTINEQKVFVDASGKFQTTLGLNSGPGSLVFSAKNKLGKQTIQSLSLVVDLESKAGGGQASAAAPSLRLALNFTKPATLSFVVDGQRLPAETVLPGSSKSISADKTILLSTSNAGGVKVAFNGRDLGRLGRDGEILTDLPFSADTLGTLSNSASKINSF